MIREANARNVLIVDDDETLGRAMSRWLTRLNLVPTLVHSAEEGLEIATYRSFGLAIVDLYLPEPRGHKVLKTLRARSPTLPVIIVIGTENIEDAITSLRATATDFIRKPFSFDQLRDAVERALGFGVAGSADARGSWPSGDHSQFRGIRRVLP